MVHILSYVFVALGAGALGAFGLYLGYKLSRLRPHKKSEEVQSVFTNTRLD